MPKLKDVTAEELRAVIDAAQSVQADAADLERRLTSAVSKTIESPMQAASSLLSASRTLADLAAALLMRAALQEQERDIRKELEAIRVAIPGAREASDNRKHGLSKPQRE